MRKHGGLFVVRPTGFEPAAFRVGAEGKNRKKAAYQAILFVSLTCI